MPTINEAVPNASVVVLVVAFAVFLVWLFASPSTDGGDR